MINNERCLVNSLTVHDSSLLFFRCAARTLQGSKIKRRLLGHESWRESNLQLTCCWTNNIEQKLLRACSDYSDFSQQRLIMIFFFRFIIYYLLLFVLLSIRNFRLFFSRSFSCFLDNLQIVQEKVCSGKFLGFLQVYLYLLILFRKRCST